MFHKIRKATLPHLNLNNGVLALALLITLSWAWGTVQAIQSNFQLQQRVDELKQQNALSELENETASFENSYYKSDEYLELTARARLHKAAPGEKVVILPPNKATPATPPPAPEKPIKERSNLEQWLYFFFGRKTDG